MIWNKFESVNSVQNEFKFTMVEIYEVKYMLKKKLCFLKD